MASTVIRRTVICPNPQCGNDLYTKEVDDALQPVWRCTNCFHETPRRGGTRRTNHRRAIEAYLELRTQWKPLDERLEVLISNGKAMSGASLVHSSVFNYHLNKLSGTDKPTNWDIRYHVQMAKQDMAKALAFITEKESL